MKIPGLQTIITRGRQTAQNIQTRYMTPDMLRKTEDSVCFSFRKGAERVKNSGFGKWISEKFDYISKNLKIDTLKENISKLSDNIKDSFKDITKNGVGKKAVQFFKNITKNKTFDNAAKWLQNKFTSIKENKMVKRVTQAVKDFFSLEPAPANK